MEKVLTADEFLKLWNDEDGRFDPPEGWTIVEDGEWVQDYKYQFCETVYEKDGQYFMICQSRSGSPFTDWEYDDPTCSEVECTIETKVIVTYNVKK